MRCIKGFSTYTVFFLYCSPLYSIGNTIHTVHYIFPEKLISQITQIAKLLAVRQDRKGASRISVCIYSCIHSAALLFRHRRLVDVSFGSPRRAITYRRRLHALVPPCLLVYMHTSGPQSRRWRKACDSKLSLLAPVICSCTVCVDFSNEILCLVMSGMEVVILYL